MATTEIAPMPSERSPQRDGSAEIAKPFHTNLDGEVIMAGSEDELLKLIRNRLRERRETIH